MIAPLARLVRLTSAGAHIVGAMLRVTFLFPLCSEPARRRQIANWSRTALKIFGLRTAGSEVSSNSTDARLMVANHVSWLDVLAIWAQTDTVFVAKSEVGSWPVIGRLALKLGVVFIDRSKRNDAVAAHREIAKLLRRGRSVCIFPEGTSTDGGAVQRFHSPLFQAAVETGVAVQPIAIRYCRQSGARATEAAFTGDMSLLQSMWCLAGAAPIVVDIEHPTPILSAGLDRRGLAQQAHAAIDGRLRKPAMCWLVETTEMARTDGLFSVAPSFDTAVR